MQKSPVAVGSPGRGADGVTDRALYAADVHECDPDGGFAHAFGTESIE
jgi:hypothetical protein